MSVHIHVLKDLVPKNNFSIDKKVKIPFEKLEFRYGSIAFKYEVSEIKTELEFDIENFEIRPEFEVLKAYFSKTLKLKNITISIHAEFEDGKLISQLALSNDLKKITRELIESVKFTFITKTFVGKPNAIGKENLLDINQLQKLACNLDYCPLLTNYNTLVIILMNGTMA